jgi:Zn ribbon nucleic-acid-binding protein
MATDEELEQAIRMLRCSQCGWSYQDHLDSAEQRGMHLHWDEDNKIQAATCFPCYYGEKAPPAIPPEVQERIQHAMEHPETLVKRVRPQRKEELHQHKPSHVHNRIGENFGKTVCACGEPIDETTTGNQLYGVAYTDDYYDADPRS